MRALEKEKKNMSARIFLFSVLFIVEKNIESPIQDAISNPTKWKSKFWGLKIVRIEDQDVGKYTHVSKQNEM